MTLLLLSEGRALDRAAGKVHVEEAETETEVPVKGGEEAKIDIREREEEEIVYTAEKKEKIISAPATGEEATHEKVDKQEETKKNELMLTPDRVIQIFLLSVFTILFLSAISTCACMNLCAHSKNNQTVCTQTDFPALEEAHETIRGGGGGGGGGGGVYAYAIIAEPRQALLETVV